MYWFAKGRFQDIICSSLPRISKIFQRKRACGSHDHDTSSVCSYLEIYSFGVYWFEQKSMRIGVVLLLFLIVLTFCVFLVRFWREKHTEDLFPFWRPIFFSCKQKIYFLWFQDWIPSAVMKQAAFHAMAEFYQSCVCKEARSYGEQIARLQVRLYCWVKYKMPKFSLSILTIWNWIKALPWSFMVMQLNMGLSNFLHNNM